MTNVDNFSQKPGNTLIRMIQVYFECAAPLSYDLTDLLYGDISYKKINVQNVVSEMYLSLRVYSLIILTLYMSLILK